MQELVNTLNGIIWSPVLIYLCLLTGLFFSVLTRFVQIRQIREMWRLLLSGKSSDKGISSFQALAVSLSGRVGTGNIAGVAAASSPTLTANRSIRKPWIRLGVSLANWRKVPACKRTRALNPGRWPQ